jgi:hypothetical protein
MLLPPDPLNYLLSGCGGVCENPKEFLSTRQKEILSVDQVQFLNKADLLRYHLLLLLLE